MEEETLQLIRRAFEGDESALKVLYDAHALRVRAYFTRSGFVPPDAEDLLRKVFVRVFGSLGNYDPAGGQPGPWLRAAVRNTAYDVIREHWGRRDEDAAENFDLDLAEGLFVAAETSTDNPEGQKETDAVRACVAALPPDLAAVIHMRYVDGKTTRGIATARDIPKPTARLRLEEAQVKLRQYVRTKGFFK